VLQVGVDRVSVKGKTNEGVDAVGRGEAIAAHAVALLYAADERALKPYIP
jgi:2C-methyl-D-erythritol 2,4-cyclodiphosphate synthase